MSKDPRPINEFTDRELAEVHTRQFEQIKEDVRTIKNIMSFCLFISVAVTVIALLPLL